MAIHAYAPCLSYATHELDGRIPVKVDIFDSCGHLINNNDRNYARMVKLCKSSVKSVIIGDQESRTVREI